MLDNRDGDYSPVNKDWYNAEIVIWEGLLVGTEIKKQREFTGLIRQVNVSRAYSGNMMNLTAFDYIVRLQELEIEQRFEASKTEVELETPTPNYIAFSANISGNPTATSITYTNVESEDTLSASDTLYNMDDDYSTRTVVSIDTTNNIITTSSSSDAWANGDTIVKSTRVQVLDLAHTNIATFPEPLIKIKNRNDALEDPLWGGFEILYQQGQILLGKPLNWSEFLIRITYSYYPTATSLYVEDVMEDIITAEDGYEGFPFTVVDNLTESFLAMEGESIDTLKPNTEIEIIGGTAYDVGQIWYETYNRITTSLTSSDFTVPGGTIASIDLRYGRIILNSAISTSSTVTCNKDYSFITLQATGIQFTKIDFTYERTSSRLEAINQLRSLVAPNYVLYTRGSDKVWGRFLYQKDTSDFTLKNITSLSFAEDTETYTRVRLFGQNRNPENILFDPNVRVVQDTTLYYASVVNTELTFEGEKDGWRIYGTGLGKGSRIVPSHDDIDCWPVVYINNLPIDNESHQMLMQPVEIKRRETYKSECSSLCKKQKVRSYREYWVYFSHSDLDPSQSITIYKADGTTLIILDAHNSEVNYGGGYWHRYAGEGDVPWAAEASTASYWIKYSSGKLEIMWDSAKFKLHTSMFSTERKDIASASFTYTAIYQAPGGIENLIDGRFETQVQTEFEAKPPSGFVWAIIDLGSVKETDAIDLIGGFFYPDKDVDSTARKFNIDAWYSLQYSPDDVDDPDDATFYNLCPEALNFRLGGGESKSWERKELGEEFQLRYIKFIIEDMEKIPYTDEGTWAIALSELALYKDVVLSGEAFLCSTEGEEDDSHLYDIDGMLTTIGDKLYKETVIYENLTTLESLQRRGKALLREFYKNHDKLVAENIYSPHLELGHTLRVIDSKNSIDKRYFTEGIANTNGKLSLSLARYPRYTVLGGQDPGGK